MAARFDAASRHRRMFLRGLGALSVAPVLERAAAAAGVQTAPPPRTAVSRELLSATLVCGGAGSHDYDFARRRLLDAMYAAGGIRTHVTGSYADVDVIEASDLLVSYTSLVPPTPAQAAALRRHLEKGGRWFALHASNYVPAGASELPDVIGSRFITHSLFQRFPVSIAAPNDPLLAGMTSFEVEDEVYVIEHSSDIEVLLDTRWGGEVLGNRHVPEEVRPLMYRRRVGAGAVLYLALGHCNRSFDGTDGPDQPGRPGPWNTPAFQELVRRGLEWAARRREL